jgi:hypothetical protein
VWLDHTGWLLGSLRIVARFMRSAVGEARAQPGMRKFTRFSDYRRRLRQLVDVLLSSRDYYRPRKTGHRYPITRDTAEQLLEPFGAKVVRCRSAREVNDVLARLIRPQEN